jgi:hypothetical protein
VAKGIQVYRRRPREGIASALIEEIEVGDFGADDRGAVTIPVGDPQNVSIVMLAAEVEYNGRPLGRLYLNDWLITNPRGPWRWFIDRVQLSSIEDTRGGSDLVLAIRGTGIGNVALTDGESEMSAIYCGMHTTVPHSTWERILTQLKYEPAVALYLPKSLAHWPEWQHAILASQDAVRVVSRGETHSALQRCLGLLEKLHAAPYAPESWVGFFDVDKSKEVGLKALIAGVATYLNKVGHHRSRTERDATGDLVQSSVDHYEAEILVAMTQLILAYIQRLPRKRADKTTDSPL